MDEGTRAKDNAIREQFESALRAVKHHSTLQCQSMATRTSRNTTLPVVITVMILY